MTTKSSMEDLSGSEHGGPVVPADQVRFEPEIIQRIDAMIGELQLLREMVATRQSKKTETNLSDELFGSLGNGSWAEYDLGLATIC